MSKKIDSFFIGCVLLICVIVHCVLHSYNAPHAYTSMSRRYGEFQCLKVGDSLIISQGQVETDEGGVVCGTNRVPLVVNSPYVYICGNNDIKGLRYSK
jgi:uncharacterized membrane protein YdbT with pleckstrin-like domain